MKRQQRYITNDIYEAIHYIDLGYFSDIVELDIDKGVNQYQSYNPENTRKRVKLRIFEERYSGGVLDMNIFCFLIINDNDDNIQMKSSIFE